MNTSHTILLILFIKTKAIIIFKCQTILLENIHIIIQIIPMQKKFE